MIKPDWTFDAAVVADRNNSHNGLDVSQVLLDYPDCDSRIHLRTQQPEGHSNYSRPLDLPFFNQAVLALWHVQAQQNLRLWKLVGNYQHLEAARDHTW